MAPVLKRQVADVTRFTLRSYGTCTSAQSALGQSKQATCTGCNNGYMQLCGVLHDLSAAAAALAGSVLCAQSSVHPAGSGQDMSPAAVGQV